MRSFELNIFIDCKKDRLYNHLSEPINMIGLHPAPADRDRCAEGKDGREQCFDPPFLHGRDHSAAGISDFQEQNLFCDPSYKTKG